MRPLRPRVELDVALHLGTEKYDRKKGTVDILHLGTIFRRCGIHSQNSQQVEKLISKNICEFAQPTARSATRVRYTLLPRRLAARGCQEGVATTIC